MDHLTEEDMKKHLRVIEIEFFFVKVLNRQQYSNIWQQLKLFICCFSFIPLDSKDQAEK